MSIIKLDAIDSTNDYLKQLSKEMILENFTIVMANEQTNGKGQLGAKWHSDAGKNLLMSVLVKDSVAKENSIFDLNIIVALAIIKVLQIMEIPDLHIKWPNDIMAGGKKIAGILIENTIKSDGSLISVVGIGLNVNQTSFEDLPNATSIAARSKTKFDNLEDIAMMIKESLQNYFLVSTESINQYWELYNEALFLRNKPSLFQNKDGNQFTGIIKHVTQEGKLALMQNDNLLHFYEAKEIKLLF